MQRCLIVVLCCAIAQNESCSSANEKKCSDGKYLTSPKNFRAKILNFDIFFQWDVPINSSCGQLTYDICSYDYDRWCCVPACQHLASTNCTYKIEYIDNDYTYGVLAKNSNCTNEISQTSLSVAPLEEMTLLPPNFKIKSYNTLWFLIPEKDVAIQEALLVNDFMYQVEISDESRKMLNLSTEKLSTSEISLGRFDHGRACFRIRYYSSYLVEDGFRVGSGKWSRYRCSIQESKIHRTNAAMFAVIAALALFLLVACWAAYKLWCVYRRARREGKILPPQLVEALMANDLKSEDAHKLKEETCPVILPHHEETCPVILPHYEETCPVILPHQEEICPVILPHQEEICPVILPHQEEICPVILPHHEETCPVILPHQESRTKSIDCKVGMDSMGKLKSIKLLNSNKNEVYDKNEIPSELGVKNSKFDESGPRHVAVFESERKCPGSCTDHISYTDFDYLLINSDDNMMTSNSKDNETTKSCLLVPNQPFYSCPNSYLLPGLPTHQVNETEIKLNFASEENSLDGYVTEQKMKKLL